MTSVNIDVIDTIYQLADQALKHALIGNDSEARYNLALISRGLEFVDVKEVKAWSSNYPGFG